MTANNFAYCYLSLVHPFANVCYARERRVAALYFALVVLSTRVKRETIISERDGKSEHRKSRVSPHRAIFRSSEAKSKFGRRRPNFRAILFSLETSGGEIADLYICKLFLIRVCAVVLGTACVGDVQFPYPKCFKPVLTPRRRCISRRAGYSRSAAKL